jgi:hypothetical protein
MYLPDDSDVPKVSQAEETADPDITESNAVAGTDDEDFDPPLDESDLEENNLSVEEADQIVWDPPKTSSAGPEEKDISA